MIDIYEAIARMMPYAKGVSAKSYDFDDAGRETTLDLRPDHEDRHRRGLSRLRRHRIRGEQAQRARGIHAPRSCSNRSEAGIHALDDGVVERLSSQMALRNARHGADVAQSPYRPPWRCASSTLLNIYAIECAEASDDCSGENAACVRSTGSGLTELAGARILPAGAVPGQARRTSTRRCRRPEGWSPWALDRTHILVLNYNGRALLGECLPSIVEAAPARPSPLRGLGRRQRLDRRLARASSRRLARGCAIFASRTGGSPRSTTCSPRWTSRSSCC